MTHFVLPHLDCDEAEITKIALTGKRDGEFLRATNGEAYHAGFVFPLEALPSMLEFLKTRAKAKKAYDDTMHEFYKIANTFNPR